MQIEHVTNIFCAYSFGVDRSNHGKSMKIKLRMYCWILLRTLYGDGNLTQKLRTAGVNIPENTQRPVLIAVGLMILV